MSARPKRPHRSRRRWLRWAVPAAAAAVAAWLALAGDRSANGPIGREEGPLRLIARVVARHPHDPGAFTQGLLWHRGGLYESTGQYGSSSLRRVSLEKGEVEARVDLPGRYFGEGLAAVGERLLQLTWREETLRIYDLASLELLEERSLPGESWGLCFDSRSLIRSDGSDLLTFHDPENLIEERRLAVTLEGRPQRHLNELEWAEGWIYANVWQSESILRIDPQDGRVRAVIDASNLLAPAERGAAGVLNGIAYREETSTFLLTGKNWPALFEVVFVEEP